MTPPFKKGDYVKIDLPDPDGIDAKHDGKTGTVTKVFEDDLGNMMDDVRYNYKYTIELDGGGTFNARWTDLTYEPRE